MKKTKQVKAHTRKTKSGKITNVKAHKAEYDSTEDIAKEALKKAKGAGEELKSKNSPIDYNQYGFSTEDFIKFWQPYDKNTFDKKVQARVEKGLKKLMGDSNYNYFMDATDAGASYHTFKNKKEADNFFKKEILGLTYPDPTNVKGRREPLGPTCDKLGGDSLNTYYRDRYNGKTYCKSQSGIKEISDSELHHKLFRGTGSLTRDGEKYFNSLPKGRRRPT